MSAAPKLRGDVAIVEQRFRGEQSFVVKDRATGKYFRMRAAEVAVLRTFDGTGDHAACAARLAAQGLRVTEGAVAGFARTCARLGLLEHTLAERSTLQLERLRAERRRHRSLFRGELLRLRFSFGDPDRLMTRALPYLRWCFTRGFVLASAALWLVYVAVIATEWPRFHQGVLSLASFDALSAGRVLLFVLVSAAVIGIHELGHGFACKHFGGEVHEMGVMLVYFQPAFYCNVNDAWSFPELRSRLWVTAAGGWIELVVGALASLVWWAARPDTLVADVALMATMLAGFTAVVTNLNPLLPLDGYFALSDWLEIPNLRLRALEYVGWWVRRQVLRLDVAEPAATARERRVFLIYGSCAVVYIAAMLVVFGFLLVRFGGERLGGIGVVLGLGVVWMLGGRMVGDWMSAVRRSVVEHRVLLARWARPRLGAAAGALALLLLAGALVPWPITAAGRFRAESARGAVVVAAVPGVVTEVLVREGQRVAAGAPLLQLTDATPGTERVRRAREADSLLAHAAWARSARDGGEAARLERAGAAAETRRAAADRAVTGLAVRAVAGGEVLTARPEALLGRRLAAGEPVLAIGDADSVEVRIALATPGAARVRAGQVARLVSYADVAHPREGRVTSVAPMGTGAGRGPRAVEARVRLPRDAAWRPGVRGEARVEVARSSVLGAVWFAVRARLRTDLLL